MAEPTVSDDLTGALTQPPLGRTVRAVADRELGTHLLETRGIHWIHAANGDPYAAVLRGQSDDPYPEYERLRARGPLSFSPTGSWVVSGHALAAGVLSSPDFGVSGADGGPVAQQVLSYGEGCPLEHERGLPAARGAAESGDRAVVERVHRETLEGLAPDPSAAYAFELVGGFVRPAVTAATAAVLGVPADRRAEFGALVEQLRPLSDSLLAPQSLRTVRAADDALAALTVLLADSAAGSSADTPADSPADSPAGSLRPDGALLSALGVSAAVQLTGNAVLALLAHPGQWKELCERPGLAPSAVEETLRFDPPVQLDARVVRTETELAGRRLPVGAHVVVLTAAAGRDPEVFTDPERFDLARPDAAAHLALHPAGPYGPVASLVRLQAEVALRTLAGRFPGLRQAGPVLRPRRAPVGRGPLSVPVSA
ncbi:P450-derived glycosyltransferase activator [Streptomyces sp. WAC01280]|uniref:cytochrome P450 family protein n=1 Tax=Streptomyces sp. WAC01280 TaxID=2487424 RepID=UPI000F7ADF9D|nr:P450-derived glycosyltransferase activator [Streptomyces sp. WAC01280]RSS55206.1 P450-derived glycosyltransferase activator [Streptomyces sp. WAC01280]